MRDWIPYVREHLQLPELRREWEEEAVQELASQLEEAYLEARSQGLPEEHADALARQHIDDWPTLAAAIRRAERSRGHRRSRLERWAEHTEQMARSRGGLGYLIADLGQDLRLALRGFRRNPGFLLAALLTLGVGIGGVTTIFTIVDRVLIRPLPYEDSGRLVVLWEKLASFDNASVAYPNFLDWRARNHVFEDLAAWNSGHLTLSGVGSPVELDVIRASASLFPLLRAELLTGRAFLPEEDRVGAERVVLLTHAVWETRFGAEPDIVGRTLSLDGQPHTVVGVLRGDFVYPPDASPVDLYVPIEQYAEDWMVNRGNHPGITVLGRLSEGRSFEEAGPDMERVAIELEAEYSEVNLGSRVNVALLQERITRDSRDTLLLLFAAVGVLLLIACTNVANLALARASSREREVALRATLGAGGYRIARLLLIESVSLWVLGGLLGILMAREGTLLVASLFADEIPRIFELSVDLRVVGLALLLSLLTGILFGLIPALKSLTPDLQQFLKEGARFSAGLARARSRGSLVIAEVGLAVALLIGAGLTLRSFREMVRTSPGLDPQHVVTVEINLPPGRYPDTGTRRAFFENLLDRVRAIPGVRSAATSHALPLGPDRWQTTHHAEGQPPEDEGRYTFAEVSSVSPDYFATMGIPLLQGRDFNESDGPEAPGVVLIDQALADRYWPGESALGKRLKFGDFSSQNEWLEVVGVVGHVKLNGVVNEVLPQFYIPHGQGIRLRHHLVVKSERDPALLADPIRRAVLELDPDQPISEVREMEDLLHASVRSGSILALLLGVFAAVALLLASVGIYGVMSHATAARRHEIGIRIALGARRGEVLRMVLRQGMSHVTAGVALGIALSAAISRLMQAQLFGISAHDPVSFVGAPLFLFLVAALANLAPASRATAVDPVGVLHAE